MDNKFLRYKKNYVCLGTWSLGGYSSKNKSYKKLSKKNIFRILDEALEKNIKFFDTAPVYGQSEKYLGECIKNFREKVVIASKIGCIDYKKKPNFNKKSVSDQFEKILKNLRTDYIDIIQLYNPNPNDKNILKAIEVLEKFKLNKKINTIGVTLSKPEDYLILREKYKFKFVQSNFNILDHRLISNQILKKIKQDKAKIYARTILNFGIFTEFFLNRKNHIFDKSDHRYNWDFQQIERWKSHAKMIKTLLQDDIENIAYRFVNSFDINGIIIGAKKKEHINKLFNKKNFIKLNNSELNQIFKIYNYYSKEKLRKPKYII